MGLALHLAHVVPITCAILLDISPVSVIAWWWLPPLVEEVTLSSAVVTPAVAIISTSAGVSARGPTVSVPFAISAASPFSTTIVSP